MVERVVIVHRSFDVVQAEMLGDVLRGAGLAARVVGTRSGAAIGVGQVILHVHIEVPESQAGQATEILEAFLAGDGAELLRAAGELPDDDEDADDAPRETPRRRFIAVGIALIMPLGAGHVYARRPWTAMVILAGQLLAIGILGAGSWRDLVLGGVLFGALVVGDIVGALVAIGAERRGVRSGPLAQIAVGLALVALGLVGGRLAGARGPSVRLFPPGLSLDPALSLEAAGQRPFDFH